MATYYSINDYRDYISHHGIRGQRWGKRNGPPYPLSASDHSASEKKAGWKDSLKEPNKLSRRNEASKASSRVNNAIESARGTLEDKELEAFALEEARKEIKEYKLDKRNDDEAAELTELSIMYHLDHSKERMDWFKTAYNKEQEDWEDLTIEKEVREKFGDWYFGKFKDPEAAKIYADYEKRSDARDQKVTKLVEDERKLVEKYQMAGMEAMPKIIKESRSKKVRKAAERYAQNIGYDFAIQTEDYKKISAALEETRKKVRADDKKDMASVEDKILEIALRSIDVPVTSETKKMIEPIVFWD